ncbi:unnamed protein product [marine sediment metagenome]|uniref:Uncharacterized protein n=1 Tax=marine sediment metagenome TaxID=412755 RepID=X0YTR4_9ZZZZ
MVNNVQQGQPAPEQPWSWARHEAYAAYDCDDLQHAEVAVMDDTAAGDCAETDGVLDGGGTAKSICVCSGASGTWASR